MIVILCLGLPTYVSLTNLKNNPLYSDFMGYVLLLRMI